MSVDLQFVYLIGKGRGGFNANVAHQAGRFHFYIQYGLLIFHAPQQGHIVVAAGRKLAKTVADQVAAVVQQKLELAEEIVLERELRSALDRIARIEADPIDANGGAQIEHDESAQYGLVPFAFKGVC